MGLVLISIIADFWISGQEKVQFCFLSKCQPQKYLLFATPETTDGLGKSTQTISEGNALRSVLSNLSLTIF